jgi:Tol biopolymer transport system component
MTVAIAMLTLIASGLLLSEGANRAGAAFPGHNGRIAFWRISQAPHGNGFKDTIYTVTKRGTHPRALTSGCCSNSDPDWSPNGKRVAFSRNDRIFTMRANGTGLRRLTKGRRFHGKHFDDFGPAWSPSGKRLVFWRSYKTPKSPSDLFTIRADGSKLRSLKTANLDESEPSWSPNGNRIAFAATESHGASTHQTPGIYTMRPSGAHVKLVLKVGNQKAGLDWSPSAKRLAFARGSGGGTQIFTVRANGAHQTQLTHLGRPAFDPAFSPNGKRIVFTSHGALHLVKAGGGKSSVLLRRSGRASDVAPDWQPR